MDNLSPIINNMEEKRFTNTEEVHLYGKERKHSLKSRNRKTDFTVAL